MDNYISKNELKQRYQNLLKEYAGIRLLLGIAIRQHGSGLLIPEADRTITINKEVYENTFAGKRFDINVDTESDKDNIKVTMKWISAPSDNKEGVDSQSQ